MQFSTIFSVAALIAAVAAAPAQDINQNSGDQSSYDCSQRTDGRNVAACCDTVAGAATQTCNALVGVSALSTCQSSTSSVKCCKSDAKGLIVVSNCVNLL